MYVCMCVIVYVCIYFWFIQQRCQYVRVLHAGIIVNSEFVTTQKVFVSP
jgi:hypothetical protein